jgi:hypothetical protein
MDGSGLLFIIIILTIVIIFLIRPVHRLLNRSKWDVFVSHVSLDNKIIEPIVSLLKDKGFKIWFDRAEIPPEFGIVFRGIISEGIQLSSHALLFTSTSYFASPYCREEADFFLKRFSRVPKRIIEVRLEPNIVRHTLKIPEESLPIDLWGFSKGGQKIEYDFDALIQQIADRLKDGAL